MSEVTLIRVFVRAAREREEVFHANGTLRSELADAPAGGNPVPLVADARGMTAAAMQAVAAAYGHESAFVLPSERGCDWRLRFFVPQHEMEMCGHATVGTLWALRQWGQWTKPTATIETLSGVVLARWDEGERRVWISQPEVRLETLSDADSARVAAQLNLPPGPSQGGYRAVNATTSRAKTLLELPSVEALDGLKPDFATMEALCESIASTGLYPYAFGGITRDGKQIVHARQFPKSSGYPEDAATGIAAAALWGYLARRSSMTASIAVWQGDTMGSPSEILVAPRHSELGEPAGCWLSGNVAWSHP